MSCSFVFRLLLVVAVAQFTSLGASGTGYGDDWNQWLGKNRDSSWNETGIIDAFPSGGPKVVWRQKIGSGYAGPAVAGGRVFVADYVKTAGDDRPDPGKKSELKGNERILCLDEKTGNEIWKHEYDCPYKLSYPAGPRVTPTVDDDRVYTLGAEGNLFCLATDDGKVIWKKELKKEYGMELAPHWGFAGHPLVHSDKLFCLVGGEGSVVVAFDKKTGKEIWRALSAKEPGYCPPTMIRAGGVEQLIVWHPESINSLNPETGEVYWSFEIRPKYAMSIVAPIKHEDYLLAVALQGTSILLKLDRDRPAATEVWRGKTLHPDHNPPIVVDGYVYGVDARGQLRCFELVSGERKWETLITAPNGRPANSATAFMVKNADKYFIATETGELILAKLKPSGVEEVGRIKMLEPTTSSGRRKVVWSHPAFANKCVFARNDKEIVCISLAK